MSPPSSSPSPSSPEDDFPEEMYEDFEDFDADVQEEPQPEGDNIPLSDTDLRNLLRSYIILTFVGIVVLLAGALLPNVGLVLSIVRVLAMLGGFGFAIFSLVHYNAVSMMMKRRGLIQDDE